MHNMVYFKKSPNVLFIKWLHLYPYALTQNTACLNIVNIEWAIKARFEKHD